MAIKTCYIMVRDVEGQEVGLEWGADYGLDEGEELPDDHEELTEAQYTIYKFVRALQGVFDELSKEDLAKELEDKPTGLIVPAGISEQT